MSYQVAKDICLVKSINKCCGKEVWTILLTKPLMKLSKKWWGVMCIIQRKYQHRGSKKDSQGKLETSLGQQFGTSIHNAIFAAEKYTLSDKTFVLGFNSNKRTISRSAEIFIVYRRKYNLIQFHTREKLKKMFVRINFKRV